MVFCRKTSECPAVSEKLKSFECVHIWVKTQKILVMSS